jgi:hypothetical protein
LKIEKWPDLKIQDPESQDFAALSGVWLRIAKCPVN